MVVVQYSSNQSSETTGLPLSPLFVQLSAVRNADMFNRERRHALDERVGCDCTAWKVAISTRLLTMVKGCAYRQ